MNELAWPWERETIVVHPTDTLPGLTFDPRWPGGLGRIAEIKGRPITKPLIGLVGNWESVHRAWTPLPDNWYCFLQEFWPSPLSVVWKRADTDELAFCSGSTLALRWPEFSDPTADWFRDFLSTFSLPVPSTSINRHGSPPARTKEEVQTVLAEVAKVNIPAQLECKGTTGQASTVIEIMDERMFRLLRPGPVEPTEIIKGAGVTCINSPTP